MQPSLGLHYNLQKLQVTAGMQTGEQNQWCELLKTRVPLLMRIHLVLSIARIHRGLQGLYETILEGNTIMRQKAVSL